MNVLATLKFVWLAKWTRWIGLRYLKSKKRSRFLSFITFLSMFGVGLGVTAMIVVMSVMDGFEEELKKRLMASDLHILVTPKATAPNYQGGFVQKGLLSQGSGIAQLLAKDPRVSAYWSVVSTEAILKSGIRVSGVVIKGVEEDRIAHLKEKIVESEDDKSQDRSTIDQTRYPGAYIGQELAYMMGLIPGDLITLISPTESRGPVAGVPRMKRFVVEGVYRSGLPEQELHTVFARAKSVRSFLRKRGVVSQWEISVREFDDAPKLAASLKKVAGSWDVKDWIELNSSLFASLKLERVAMFIILAFIVVVASFNIVTTLTLTVLEKRREISILRAMGARPGQVGAIFLSEGLLIGLVGASGGAALAWIICSLLKRYEFIALPDIYYDRTLPVTFDPIYYIGIGGCALLIVLLAAIYPSLRAARLHPLAGIRAG